MEAVGVSIDFVDAMGLIFGPGGVATSDLVEILVDPVLLEAVRG